MKHGLEINYWNEYIFKSYYNFTRCLWLDSNLQKCSKHALKTTKAATFMANIYMSNISIPEHPFCEKVLKNPYWNDGYYFERCLLLYSASIIAHDHNLTKSPMSLMKLDNEVSSFSLLFNANILKNITSTGWLPPIPSFWDYIGELFTKFRNSPLLLGFGKGIMQDFRPPNETLSDIITNETSIFKEGTVTAQNYNPFSTIHVLKERFYGKTIRDTPKKQEKILQIREKHEKMLIEKQKENQNPFQRELMSVPIGRYLFAFAPFTPGPRTFDVFETIVNFIEGTVADIISFILNEPFVISILSYFEDINNFLWDLQGFFDQIVEFFNCSPEDGFYNPHQNISGVYVPACLFTRLFLPPRLFRLKEGIDTDTVEWTWDCEGGSQNCPTVCPTQYETCEKFGFIDPLDSLMYFLEWTLPGLIDMARNSFLIEFSITAELLNRFKGAPFPTLAEGLSITGLGKFVVEFTQDSPFFVDFFDPKFKFPNWFFILNPSAIPNFVALGNFINEIAAANVDSESAKVIDCFWWTLPALILGIYILLNVLTLIFLIFVTVVPKLILALYYLLRALEPPRLIFVERTTEQLKKLHPGRFADNLKKTKRHFKKK